jgi:hypothetical protein
MLRDKRLQIEDWPAYIDTRDQDRFALDGRGEHFCHGGPRGGPIEDVVGSRHFAVLCGRCCKCRRCGCMPFGVRDEGCRRPFYSIGGRCLSGDDLVTSVATVFHGAGGNVSSEPRIVKSHWPCTFTAFDLWNMLDPLHLILITASCRAADFTEALPPSNHNKSGVMIRCLASARFPVIYLQQINLDFV